MGFRLLARLGVVVVLFWSGLVSEAQSSVPACGVPPVVAANSQPNIFSEQQEQWLGNAMADEVEREFRPVRDESYSAHLQSIVDKLAATLPDTHIKFRVLMVDSSEINGFSIAGGHIYLMRKLASAAENDDELAAVLGHEIGHIASHQFAFETTRDLKRLLGITSVGDRADIYRKYEQLMDARLKDKHPGKSGDSDEGQDEADKVGVWVTAAAGYSPAAGAALWNRVTFSEGKTGGRMSDFFRITKPNEKRLRGMMKMDAALPAGCGAKVPTVGQAFVQWHHSVIANQAADKPVTNLGREVKLTPPLHMDLERLRFSPDGKTILAQDEGSIFTMTREPFAAQFRFDAENAWSAQFSPDSQKIVFGTPGLHTEEWGIAEKKMLVANEPVARHECLESKLSPDGRTVVCVSLDDDDWQMNLELLDSANGSVLFEKKNFFVPTWYIAMLMFYSHSLELTAEWLPSSFSADGNYLLIGPGDEKLGFDMRTRTPLKIGADLRGKINGSYAFLGSTRVVGVNRFNAKDSGIFSFPEGKQVQKLNLPSLSLASVSDPDNAGLTLIVGLKDSRIGLADMSSGKVLMTSTVSAVDYWNGYVTAENANGSVILAKLKEGHITDQQTVALPLSPLGPLRSVAVSPDEKHIALSTRSHGGVWNLATGKQEFATDGFTNATWAEDGSMYAEFPKTEKLERHVAQLIMSPKAAKDLSYTINEKVYMSYGQLVEWKQLNKGGWELTVHKLSDASVAWTKTFPDGPLRYTESFGGRELLFTLPLKLNSVKIKIKEDSTLASEAAAVKIKDNGRLVEVTDRTTGTTLAEMVLELPPNYNGTDGLNRAGDLLYMTSTDNRTVVYSLKTGKQLRQVFGNVVAIDPVSQRVCTVNRRDEAVVYDSGGRELAHFRIGSVLRHASFLSKGADLLMLTADQTVRIVAISKGDPGIANAGV